MKDVICRKALILLAKVVFKLAVKANILGNDEWVALERLSEDDFSWFEEDEA